MSLFKSENSFHDSWPQFLGQDADSSDWLTYYYQNSMNAEFMQYRDYYIRALKDCKKVLIIEDDDLSFKIIQSFIKSYDPDIRCFFASNEKDAMEIIQTFHCDLVIADYFIADEKTGLDICHRVKNEYPEISCSIVSSLKHDQYQDLLKYADVQPIFFEKPVSKNKITHYLEEVYGDRHV